MDTLDLTKVDIETIAPIINKVSASFEPTSPFLKFEVKPFSTYIKVFEAMPKTSQDIVSRACLFEFTEDGKLTATMSDGIFYGTIQIPYTEKKQDFPQTFILDYESLLRVSVAFGHTIYLVYKDSSFYIEYDSGSLYVPDYNLKPEKIKGRISLPSSLDSKELSAFDFLKYVKLAKTFLASNQLKPLAFAHFTDNALFSSNGYTVLKGNYKLPFSIVFRASDLAFLDTFIPLSYENLKVASTASRIIVSSNTGVISFPVYNEKFSEADSKRFEEFKPQNYYTVDYEKTMLLLNMLSKVYRSSNVVSLKSENGILTMTSTSLDGKVSFATLSQKLTGIQADSSVSFSVTGLLSVLKTLEPYRFLNLAIFENCFGLFNAEVAMIVFGMQGQIKKVK
jgi:hypothetical protein